MGGLGIPVAIVLIGGLIILGVTKMLSSERTYRNLVREMQSKTFGNRWVAAFELSKLVAGQGIGAEEIPWLVENLAALYRETVDHRTRNFIIITLGALKHPATLPSLEQALNDPDKNVAFNAIVAVGNLPRGMGLDWAKLMDKMESPDEGIRHAATLALAAQRVEGAQGLIERRLQDKSISVRYAAALALIQYRSPKAMAIVKKILSQEVHDQFNALKWQRIRLNVISAIGREGWGAFVEDLQKIVRQTLDLRIETTANEALNLLKI